MAAPSNPQVVEWFLGVEADEHRRAALIGGNELMQQAIRDGVIEQSENAKDAFARAIVQLAHANAIEFMHRGLSKYDLLPHEADGYRLSLCHDFHSGPNARSMLPATATQSITVHGNVGQLAGRDITNLVMIIDQAEAHLEASDCTPEQREQARSRLRTLRNAVQTGGVDVASKTLAELMLRFAGLP